MVVHNWFRWCQMFNRLICTKFGQLHWVIDIRGLITRHEIHLCYRLYLHEENNRTFSALETPILAEVLTFISTLWRLRIFNILITAARSREILTWEFVSWNLPTLLRKPWILTLAVTHCKPRCPLSQDNFGHRCVSGKLAPFVCQR